MTRPGHHISARVRYSFINIEMKLSLFIKNLFFIQENKKPGTFHPPL